MKLIHDEISSCFILISLILVKESNTMLSLIFKVEVKHKGYVFCDKWREFWRRNDFLSINGNIFSQF